MTWETEAMSKEDVRIDWDSLARGVVDHNQTQTSADYGTSSSSGSSSALDKRKPKKLREWVKEEPKEGEIKKPHPASRSKEPSRLLWPKGDPQMALEAGSKPTRKRRRRRKTASSTKSRRS